MFGKEQMKEATDSAAVITAYPGYSLVRSSTRRTAPCRTAITSMSI